MITRTNKKHLRRNSLALGILSALATKSLRIAATSLAVAAAPYPRTRRVRRWQYAMFDRAHTVTIDLEAILADRKKRRRIAQVLSDLKRQRFVRQIQRGHHVFLEITTEGRRRLVPASLKTLRIEPPTQWDEKWRIILFDIPEANRYGRDMLRSQLRALGFFPLQKSAFVCPYRGSNVQTRAVCNILRNKLIGIS